MLTGTIAALVVELAAGGVVDVAGVGAASDVSVVAAVVSAGAFSLGAHAVTINIKRQISVAGVLDLFMFILRAPCGCLRRAGDAGKHITDRATPAVRVHRAPTQVSRRGAPSTSVSSQ